MEDTLTCPICGNKLRNNRLVNEFIHLLDKTSTFVERSCTAQFGHSLQFFTDTITGKVDLLKLSLTPQYSRFIEINYISGKSRISCLKNSKADYIEIERILEPDYPYLLALKEKVGLFVILS
jgi:hypothetical protein